MSHACSETFTFAHTHTLPPPTPRSATITIVPGPRDTIKPLLVVMLCLLLLIRATAASDGHVIFIVLVQTAHDFLELVASCWEGLPEEEEEG